MVLPSMRSGADGFFCFLAAGAATFLAAGAATRFSTNELTSGGIAEQGLSKPYIAKIDDCFKAEGVEGTVADLLVLAEDLPALAKGPIMISFH